MAILEEEKPCMVPTVTKGTPKTLMLSAMQVKKGLKKKEVTYLATLKEEMDDGSGEPMPKEIKGVLDEFKDVMPPELPKGLFPRREEDHKIELKPGARPLAMGPYKMTPLELEELRRQLKELLDAGFIQPSKAPYGDGKNKYPILLIANLFDQLDKARYFTKLDLRSGYYQVRIAEGDKPKTTCVTKQVRVVYLDDIVIYNNTLKEHVEHLRKVFKILRQNELYVKKEKCPFAKKEVSFLGLCIRDGKLMMDDSKVKAIQKWDPPTKKAVIEEPMLALPDHTKVFEVHIDASDFAIRRVLMQERHPIAFKSRKLNDTERRYTVQEKETTIIVHCLRTWRHYLLGSHFLVKTDNVATSYFQTQKNLSPKQARWQDFLAEFNYTLEYKPESANHVVDALSRKTELASMTSQPQ
ncbi:Retrovirus-related Pol polyprotein from transposon 297 [Vitis vinifera]|uniref:Retrovirus-related Pol polyprotein from transposon 297 n=1 Tax=Vitis vinifera TaxID=29760 RepID=A0A438EUK6_VITVI|nr:Retrovirus-related Pol polyprotein from transposon 297 [Vitis vinifera]